MRNQLSVKKIKKDRAVEIVFSSLQNLKNTYKYTFEQSNMLSKNSFNLFYLTYYLYNYIFKNFFNFLFNPLALNLELVRNRRFFKKKVNLFMNLNNYIFFSKKWCIFFFNFMILKRSLVDFKRRKEKKMLHLDKPIKLSFFSFILLQKLFLIIMSFLY